VPALTLLLSGSSPPEKKPVSICGREKSVDNLPRWVSGLPVSGETLRESASANLIPKRSLGSPPIFPLSVCRGGKIEGA